MRNIAGRRTITTKTISTRGKYNARKVEIDGIRFDSKKEANRYLLLKARQEAGEIHDLKCHVPYELLPSQKVEGHKTLVVVKYVADFVYNEGGKTVVEDVKGFRMGQAYALFSIKKKLMYYRYGIYVEEV